MYKKNTATGIPPTTPLRTSTEIKSTTPCPTPPSVPQPSSGRGADQKSTKTNRTRIIKPRIKPRPKYIAARPTKGRKQWHLGIRTASYRHGVRTCDAFFWGAILDRQDASPRSIHVINAAVAIKVVGPLYALGAAVVGAFGGAIQVEV